MPAGVRHIGERLYKSEKLCSHTALELLVGSRRDEDTGTPRGRALAYPLRLVWREDARRQEGARFVIIVPKKRIRGAVERVLMRRRIREAYRRNRTDALRRPLDLAFIYVADAPLPHAKVVRAMRRLLATL